MVNISAFIFEEKQTYTNFPWFSDSRRENYEFSVKFRTQMSDGYDFFPSVRDSVSIWHAFGAKSRGHRRTRSQI